MSNYFYNLWSAVTGRAGMRSDGQQSSISGGGPDGVSPDTALRLSAVWACVRIRAEAIGSMPIVIYKKNKDGTREVDRSHWLNRVLVESPNQYQTRNEFFETLSINQDLSGNFYARVTRKKNGEIVSLLPLMSQQMQVKLEDGAKKFEYSENSQSSIYLQDKIWHGMMMPSNGIVGLSPIEYASRALGISNAAEDRVKALGKNGFKPTGILMLDKVLKKDQREDMRGKFNDLAAGTGDPLKILEAGMKYQQISMNPKDVQLLETRRFSVEDLARIFGTPSVLINDTSASTVWGSGIAQIKQGFYEFGLRPTLERMEAGMKKWLLPPEERKKYDIEFDFSAFIRGNEREQADVAKTRMSSGQTTINEERRERGRRPVEGGDKIYLQQQMIPLDDLEKGQDNAV